MNRHAHCALLTPLMLSAVALPPTAVAQAAPAAPASAPQAACALKVAQGTNPVEFDLELSGFKPGQKVKVTGAEEFTRNVDQKGSFTEQDVKKGSYTAKTFGKNNKQAIEIGCTKPARVPTTTTAVRISDADVTAASTATPEVDCSVPQKVTFKGKLTGSGSGDVDYKWQGGSKSSSPTVKFTAPETATADFNVTVPAHAAPTAPPPRVTATLTAGNASDALEFTLKCKANT
ncbi:hypothetical protein ACIGQE_21605 [Streptomyces sp. NPDC053429]|uniref:hypothetical protein n=1 Tax=Streptomyces sp. NPDC053429 TaxID=3365702 RepID=UPI0037D810BA